MTKNWRSTIFICISYLFLCDATTVYFGNTVTKKAYMYWENATVPFYIEPDHFDSEQSMAIMTALSMFAFKTCLKFAPVMTAPKGSEHVLVFVNPGGTRRCVINTSGHSVFEPHKVTLGYECLKSPEIDMMIMKALGLPFEHNRWSRDLYIDVLIQNIEPGAVELFTKDTALPKEMQSVPYDINSVMHFGEREYTKNGHRTIIFKDRKQKQLRVGLTELDLRKIELVYGPECLKRDRQEKIDMCQAYPGVARRKRDVDPTEIRNLRVNREITAPPNPNNTDTPENNANPTEDIEKIAITEIEDDKSMNSNEDFDETFKELGIADEVQDIMDQVHKVSSLALKNARVQYCNITKPDLRTDGKRQADLLGIVSLIAEYAKSLVDNAVANLTVFCLESESVESYQRQRCNWNFGPNRCRQTYRSTKSGAVKYSTQHRPLILQSTRVPPSRNRIFVLRADDDHTTNFTDVEDKKTQNRKKREVTPDVSTIILNAETVTENVTKVDGDAQKTVVPGYRKMNRKSAEFSKRRLRAHQREDELDDQEYPEQLKSVEKSTNDDQRQYDNPGMHHESQEKIHRISRIRKRPQIEPDRTLHNFKETSKEDQHETKHKKRKNEHIREKHTNRIRNKKREQDDNESKNRDSEKELDRDRRSGEDKRHRGKGKKRDDSRADLGREQSDSVQAEKSKPEVKLRLNRIRKTTPQPKLGVPRTVVLNKLNKEFYDERKWPTMVVPYILPNTERFDIDDVRNRLDEVNRILKRRTCVSIKEVTEESAQQYEDYLVLDMSPDYVTGRVGGRQNFGSIELLQGGQHRQHTAMMVMAMLGFYFEVSRHDRDSYIRVHMRHIRPDKLHHFEKIREEATLDVPYDYYSATHPAWQFWRKIGKTGISTVATFKQQDPDGSIMKTLGQNRKLLSDIDIIKINSVYGVDCFLPEEREMRDQKNPTFEDGYTQGFV